MSQDSQHNPAAETAHVVGEPWGDGTWVVLGNGDPHVSRFLAHCDAQDAVGEDHDPDDDRARATEIARRWNDAPVLRRRVLDLRTVLEAVEETGLIEGHLARVIERTLNHQAIPETTA